MVLRAQRVSGVFEKRAPGLILEKKNCFSTYGVPFTHSATCQGNYEMLRDEVVAKSIIYYVEF